MTRLTAPSAFGIVLSFSRTFLLKSLLAATVFAIGPLAAHAAANTSTAAVTVTNSSTTVGSVEMLSTTVTNTDTSTTVTGAGTVLFCDSTYEKTLGTCGARSLIGPAQITANGTASIVVRLAPGIHSLYAKFVGTPGAAAALLKSNSSASLTSFTVSGGQYPLTNVLSSTGTVSSSFTYTDTLVSTPGQSAPGTTTATITDTTSSNTLGTVTFGATGSAVTFSPPAPYAPKFTSSNSGSKALVKGDFNRDGILDLLDFGSGSTLYGLLNGNANGSFNLPTTLVSTTNSVVSAVVADLNNDGYPDVVYYNSASSVGVLINNKAGGFNTVVSVFVPAVAAKQVIVGDFNGDGFLDIALGGGATGPNTGYFQVIYGDGSGTNFTPGPVITPPNATAAAPVFGLGAYDIDGDGYTDLFVNSYQSTATNSYYAGSASGIGGTAARSFTTAGTGSTSNFVFADLANDGVTDVLYAYGGKYDLAVSNCATLPCSFAVSTTAVTGLVTFSGAAVGDFNNDGVLDVAFGTSLGTVVVASGGGGSAAAATGVLGTPAIYSSSNVPTATVYEVIAGDFTGNGYSDLATANMVNAATIPLTVLYSGYQTTAPPIQNVSLPAYYTIVSSVASASNYTGTSTSENLGQVSGILALTVSPAGGTAPGGTIMLTGTINPKTISSNTNTPTGSFIFYDGTTALCTVGTTCPAAGSGAITFSTTATSGTHAYSVQYTGDTHYQYSTTVPLNSAIVSYTVVGSASKLAFLIYPNGAVAGSTPSNTVLAGTNPGVITAAEEDSSGNIISNTTDKIVLEVKATLPSTFSVDNIYVTGQTYAGSTVGYLTPTIVNGVATFDLSTLRLYDKGTASPGAIYTYTLTSQTSGGAATADTSAVASVYVYANGGKALLVTNFTTDPVDINTVASSNCPDMNSAGAGAPNTLCSIRDAIAVANANTPAYSISFNYTGTPIVIAPSATLSLTGGGFGTSSPSTLLVKAMTIAGPGPNNLILNGSGSTTGTTPTYAFFRTQTGLNTTINISGMTVEYANAGAAYGGALYQTGTYNGTPGIMNLNNMAFLYNTGSTNGGAIYVASNSSSTAPTIGTENVLSNLNISNSYFYGNSSVQDGGAIFIKAGASLTVANSSFVNNTAITPASGAGGGAVAIENAALFNISVFTNDTFYGNMAGTSADTNPAYGGAVYVTANTGLRSYAVFDNCTVVGNSVVTANSVTTNQGGGLYSAGNGTMTLINTIVEDNSIGTSSTAGSADLKSQAALNTAGTNLYNSTTYISTYPSLTSLGISDPAFYGGPFNTYLTLAPMPGSPILKAGTAAATSTTTTAPTVSITGYTQTPASGAATGTFTFTTSNVYIGEVFTLPANFGETGLQGQTITINAVTAGSGTNPTAFTAAVTNTFTTFTAGTYVATGTPVSKTVTSPATDARGNARPSTAPDLGAIQDNLAISFIAQPQNATTGNPITSATSPNFPQVLLTESGYNVQGVVSLTASLDPGSLFGTVTVSTVDTGTQSTSGYATFSNVYSNTPQSSTMLLVQGGTGNASVSGASASFEIIGTASTLVFGSKPATPIAAGSSPGTVTGLINDSAGNMTNSTATVKLTVTGPSGFTTATYTVNAVNGTATFSPAALTIAGTYTYSLSSTGLTSPTAVNEVVTAGTGSQLTVTGPSTAIAGTNATYTVTYTDQYGNKVTGNTDTVSITSTDSTAVVSGPTALTNSVGTFTVNYGTPGSYTVTATDASGTATAGTSPTTVVSKGSPTLTLSSSSTPATLGAPVTFTATLSPYTAGTLTTNGETITFLNNGAAIGMGTLSAGMATFTTTALPAGSDTITAMFAGDTSFNMATSGNFIETVSGDSIFIVNSGGTVTSYGMSGAPQSTAVTGGGIGAAVDSAGFVWSIDSSTGTSVTKFTDAGATANDYDGTGAGVNAAKALAIDGLGLVWIANGDGTISALTNSGTANFTQSVASAAAIHTPASLKVDSSGSLWISSQGDNSVVEVIGVAAPVTTPTVKAVSSGTLGTRP